MSSTANQLPPDDGAHYATRNDMQRLLNFMETRFDRIEARFERVDGRFERMESRMSGFEREFSKVARDLRWILTIATALFGLAGTYIVRHF